MNLLEFSQQPIKQTSSSASPPEGEDETAIGPRSFPLTIHWPAGVPLATGQHWRRLEDGCIEATYQDREELELALLITAWIREPPDRLVQGELFPRADSYYQAD